MAEHGWTKDAPIAAQWTPEGGITEPMRKLVRESLKPAIAADAVRELGYDAETLDLGTASDELLSVMTMATPTDDELWIGFNNFYVITRYNHSHLYAMAVFQLAEAIREES